MLDLLRERFQGGTRVPRPVPCLTDEEVQESYLLNGDQVAHTDACEGCRGRVEARDKERHAQMYLSDERHLAAMERMRERIASGVKLDAVDSETTGDKYTDCSWGMCSMDPEFWPVEDRMFPDREPIVSSYRSGPDGLVPIPHVSSKYHDEGQFCPFDRRPRATDPMPNSPSGCFSRCRIFSPGRDQRKPSREEALDTYDISIECFRERLARR